MKIQIEQLEPLQYIAKLQGRSVDALVIEILDGWLTDNFAETVEPLELKAGLESTVITHRGRIDQDKAYAAMTRNLAAMAC